MRKLFVAIFAFGLVALAKPGLYAKPEFKFGSTIQAAYALPEGDMKKYFDQGIGGRLKLFGGIKIPIPGLDAAAGLGIDFTYLQFKGKASDDNYRIFQWDWFTLPIPTLKLGPISFNADAGLFWNVMDLQIRQFDYGQTSIRPGFYLAGGFGIWFGPVALKGDVRYGWMFEDKERFITSTGIIEDKITMNYATYYAGFTLQI